MDTPEQMPEAGRQAAHVLLDAVSVWDVSATGQQNSAASDLALARLNEVGAVTATYDDDTEELNLDASELLGGVMVLVQQLVSNLSTCTGMDREEVIALTRESLDSPY
jgi:hypothetical protein